MGRIFWTTKTQQIQYSVPGTRAVEFTPGDFILVHNGHWTAKLIQIGQELRFHGENAKFAFWNHTALIVDSDGSIIEAVNAGVNKDNLSKYDNDYYIVVRIDASDEDRAEAVNFAKTCLGTRYGWSEIVSIALSLLSGLKFSFGFDDEMVCSGLVAKAMERTTAVFSRDSSNIAPADLAQFYQVPLPTPSQFGKPF